MSYTDSHKGKGQDYQESFAPEVNPHRAMVWRLEQRALDDILRNHLAAGQASHLDFACGTGRILAHFDGRVASSTGVDVSSSMMQVARNLAPGAELIEADLTQRDVLDQRYFDVITAFRFFPNAEPELRRAVLEVLVRHLAPQGVLVFNNHKNRSSLPRRILRFLGRNVAEPTMSEAEVQALVAGAGLRIEKIIPLAILPFSDNRFVPPVALLEMVERPISGFAALRGIAQDIIYVCRRNSAAVYPT
jgi:ubiquinone/menaquinone biosynthesis C-methylase UbiE